MLKPDMVIFRSSNDEWGTPQHVFDALNEEFHFNLDPCASDINYKCDHYITIEQDGLKFDWGGYRVFCNPPYSKVSQWVEKAYNESRKPETLVVMLIPARTDTRWFHEWIYGKAEIRFVKGRLKFGGSKNSAPFPSMVVIFRGD